MTRGAWFGVGYLHVAAWFDAKRARGGWPASEVLHAGLGGGPPGRKAVAP